MEQLEGRKTQVEAGLRGNASEVSVSKVRDVRARHRFCSIANIPLRLQRY